MAVCATAPVEYAVAVDRFLAASRISPSSVRIYRVALETWAWPLVGKTPPTGAERRGADRPTLLLSRLDGAAAAGILAAALERRALMVDRRTFERERSILRNAAHWWTAQGWISADAEQAAKAYTYANEIVEAAANAADIDTKQILTLHAPLREQTLWHLVYESAASVEHILALDVSDLDFPNRRVQRKAVARQADRIAWREESAQLLPLLTIGRNAGPLFRTERRAPERVPPADRCPYTGRARLSVRRAAELFQEATAALDPRGKGWTLRDLRLAGKRDRSAA